MTNQNLKKHTLFLRVGDWDFIESIASPRGTSTSEVVRAIVSKFVDDRREAEGSVPPNLDVNL